MSVPSGETKTWETETSHDALDAAFAFEDPNIIPHNESIVYGRSDTNTEALVPSLFVDDYHPYVLWDETIPQQGNAFPSRSPLLSPIEDWQVTSYTDAEAYSQPYSQQDEPSIDPALLELQFLQPSMCGVMGQRERMSPYAAGVHARGPDASVQEVNNGVQYFER
jgi:hypothetical protein